MFAGAAREAVFSNAEVIERINADFVPVALKAGLVNNPPRDDEGLLYREIAWKSCLLDGLKEAKAKGKPALLWVFIDRPADDARC